MITQLISLGLLMLFSVMLPGPDFALVAKNTLLHSRKSGIFTTIGITSAVLVHLSYCILGFAVIISNNLIIFSLIKYVGAGYLIYLGITSLLAKQLQQQVNQQEDKKYDLAAWAAFRQGFLCNLLNPKATLFFLVMFTVVINPQTPTFWMCIIAVEMVLIVLTWFTILTIIFSHPTIVAILRKAEKYIAKLLGISLVSFGLVIALARH